MEPSTQTQPAELQESKPPGKQMTNTKWILLLLAAAMLDGAQFLLDMVLVGLLLNIVIDFCVGVFLPFFLRSHGVNLSWKKAAIYVAGPAWEMVTDGLLPFGWIIEIVVAFLLDKAEKKLGNLPI